MKYYKINKIIDNIPISNTKTPYYYITFDIIDNCIKILYPNKYSKNYQFLSPSEVLINYIKCRLYNNSINKWEYYHKKLSRAKYIRLLKKKFSKILPLRPLRILMEYF